MTLPASELARIRDWRRTLHAHPEFGLDLPATARFVAERLASFGMKVHEGIGTCGVVGVLRRGSARRIGLRADMDALQIQESNAFAHASLRPGFMHACGHDGHAAMLLGAAQTLANLEKLDAVVHFIFQPAEEHGVGAQRMIEDGLFDRFDIDEVYALHNLPGLKVGTLATRAGPIMASEDNFTITLEGTGGHAARPHLCNDLIVAASELALALQTIVARCVDPVAPAVLSITEFTTDGTRNALPSRCVMRGDTRSYAPEIQRIVETKMRRLAAGVASMYGLGASVSYTHEFVTTCNHAAATERAVRAASAVAGATVIADCDPLMISDDFGVMLREKPGNYTFLGNGEQGTAGAEPLHSSRYDFNDAALPFGIQYFVELVRQGAPVATASH